MLDVGRAYCEHAPFVRNWLRRHASLQFTHEDIEDLTAETFTRAVRAAPRYDPRGHLVSTWLMQIARNLLLDEIERRRVRSQVSPFVLAQHTPPPADPYDDVDAALRQLPEDHRVVLVLRFWRDLTMEQSASVLGCNENAIKKRQYRALRSLRRYLEAS